MCSFTFICLLSGKSPNVFFLKSHWTPQQDSDTEENVILHLVQKLEQDSLQNSTEKKSNDFSFLIWFVFL